MIRATQVIPAGQRSGEPIDHVVLDYDQRHRRRMAMTAAGGLEFLLDLVQAVPLRDGDGLALENGSIVAVSAALEPLVEITTADAADLLRIAWHLGNRHLPTQLLGNRLRIRRDHVIEEMVGHLGATVTAVMAAFDPEAGAYAQHAAGTHEHPDNPALDHDDRLNG